MKISPRFDPERIQWQHYLGTARLRVGERLLLRVRAWPEVWVEVLYEGPVTGGSAISVSLNSEFGRVQTDDSTELHLPGHRWSNGVCLKCGEQVDAYAAARKEAR